MKRNLTRLFVFLALVACLGLAATVHAADQLKFGCLSDLRGSLHRNGRGQSARR